MLHFHSFGLVFIDIGSHPSDLIQFNKLLAKMLLSKDW